ncbi:MAG TPA: hypothetical protein VF065_12535 [Ilumatobacter sp.]
MSTAVAVAGGASDRVAWPHVLQLTGIEARRYAMRASVWIGWAGTVASAALEHPDWPGGSYENVLPLSFSMMILGVYIAGVRTGSRDAGTDVPPLAEEAAIDGGDRIAARLLGLVMPAALALITSIGIAAVSRFEGGYWMGELPRSTHSAQHTPLELLQPVLLVVLGGALGVVTGRAFRRPLLAIVAGAFGWFVLFPVYWIWNMPPMNVAVPAQTMPLRVDLHDVTTMRDLPSGWYVDYPTQYNAEYVRELVHMPTIVFHTVYLVGLIMIVGAAAARSHRRAVRRGGILLAIAGIVVQLAVSPF